MRIRIVESNMDEGGVMKERTESFGYVSDRGQYYSSLNMDGVRQILLFDDITDAFNTFRAGLSQIAVKQGIFITNGTYEWYADGALIKERCVVQCDTSEWKDSETGLHIAKVQSFASFTPDAKVHKNALDALFCLTNKLNEIFTEKKGVLIYEKIKEKD